MKRRQETPKLVPGEIMTVHEVAEYLQAHPETIYRIVSKRRIPFLRVGSDLRFWRSDLEAWMAQQVPEEPAPVTALTTHIARSRREKKTASTLTFGSVIRQRRRELDLTQQDVARRIGVSLPYISHLEKNKRHPSAKIIVNLANVLGLEPGELFLLANPYSNALVSEQEASVTGTAWDTFAKDRNLRKVHKITDQEMEFLSKVATMGEVTSPRDFVFILNTLRQTLGS